MFSSNPTLQNQPEPNQTPWRWQWTMHMLSQGTGLDLQTRQHTHQPILAALVQSCWRLHTKIGSCNLNPGVLHITSRINSGTKWLKSWNEQSQIPQHVKNLTGIIWICQLADITWDVLSNQKVAGSWENAAVHSLSQQDSTATDRRRLCVAAGADSRTTNVQGVGSTCQGSSTCLNKQKSNDHLNQQSWATAKKMYQQRLYTSPKLLQINSWVNKSYSSIYPSYGTTACSLALASQWITFLILKRYPLHWNEHSETMQDLRFSQQHRLRHNASENLHCAEGQ